MRHRRRRIQRAKRIRQRTIEQAIGAIFAGTALKVVPCALTMRQRVTVRWRGADRTVLLSEMALMAEFYRRRTAIERRMLAAADLSGFGRPNE